MLAIISTALCYGLVIFISGASNLSEIVRFLSPQTFWSRVDAWQDVFYIDFQRIYSGFGAGYFDQSKSGMDNQFLFAFLEMGLIAELAYFIAFGYILYYFSGRNDIAKVIILMFFLIFTVDDSLNAVTVPYVIGLFFGNLNRNIKPGQDYVR